VGHSDESLCIAGMLAWSASRVATLALDGPGDSMAGFFIFPIAFQCVALAAMVMIGPASMRSRCSEMQLAFPIDARTWVALRLGACALVGWLPLAIAALVYTTIVGTDILHEPTFMIMPAAAAAWAAWISACFAWRPERSRIDSPRALATLVTLGVGLMALAFWRPMISLPVSLAATATAGVCIWRGLPRALLLVATSAAAGTVADGSTGRGAESIAAGRDVRPRGLHFWLARSTVLQPRALVLFVAGAFMAATAHGATSAFLWFGPYAVGMAMFCATRILRETDHLPIPRARIAPWVFLPAGIALVGGMLCGSFYQPLTSAEMREHVDMVGTGPRLAGKVARQQSIQVPGSLCRFTVSDEVREIRSPWGEVARVEPPRVLPGLPLRIVNPYAIDSESSIDFVAWQLARALHAAHGVEVDADSLRDEYLGVLEGRVIGPFFGQRFVTAHPALDRPARPGLATAAGLIGVLLWLAAGALVTRRGVPPRDRAGWKRRRAATLAMYGAGLAALAVTMFPFLLGLHYPSLPLVAGATLVDLTGGHLWRVVLLTAVIAGAGYAWLGRRFERMEVPPSLPRPYVFR